MEGNAAAGKYHAELIATANQLSAAPRGILAADESTGTIGKRVSILIKSSVPAHSIVPSALSTTTTRTANSLIKIASHYISLVSTPMHSLLCYQTDEIH